MEIGIILCIFFLCILIAFVRGAAEEKRKRLAYRESLRKTYSVLRPRNYSHDDWVNVPRLFKSRGGEFALDDITWNDLDMDRIYALIDKTQSQVGGQYLYDMLRRPKLDNHDLERMERHIDYYMSHEEERLDTQMALRDLGNTGKYSLYEYIEGLDNIKKQSNTKHIACIVALIASIAFIAVSGVVGVIALVVVLCYNVTTYMSEKNKVLPYVSVFGYIFRMVYCAENICGSKSDEIEDYTLHLKEEIKEISPFVKKSGVIFSINSSSGNPLDIVYTYVKMFTHVDLIQFNKILNFVRDHKETIRDLALDIGYIDALISVGGFRKSVPYYSKPKFVLDKGFTILEGYHPAIKAPVANSFESKHGMLLTGSNASGKSTFLKMTAINAILSQTINTALSKEYQAPMFRIYSSMSLRDNLEGGESYYIVEIKALKRICDATEDKTYDNPLLCFVDEVLRGTNTVERIAASTEIMKYLSKDDVYCFAATHDIELTHLLEDYYDNYHFEEDVKDGDVLFTYHLLEGRARTRNAIKLLSVIGFPTDIVEEATTLATQIQDLRVENIKR